MREEYNSVLSTPIEAHNIGRFGRYRYIGKTQMSADISAMPIYRSISNSNVYFIDSNFGSVQWTTIFLLEKLLKTGIWCYHEDIGPNSQLCNEYFRWDPIQHWSEEQAESKNKHACQAVYQRCRCYHSSRCWSNTECTVVWGTPFFCQYPASKLYHELEWHVPLIFLLWKWTPCKFSLSLHWWFFVWYLLF